MAFNEFMEKVKDYKALITKYIPIAEAAIHLKQQISGEAHKEIKHLTHDEYYSIGGIDSIPDVMLYCTNRY